jgi:hypothetical protein
MTREEIATIPTPEALGARHHPVPYIDFIDSVTKGIDAIGMRILEETFGALKNGNRFFGLLEVAPKLGDSPAGYGFQIGLRASHDQSLARGLVAGERVFCCDNLCFSGEIRISTKQTTNVERRLPGMILNAVERLPGVFEVIGQRNERYKEFEMKQRWGDAALIEMVRRQILLPTQVGRALKEWDEPSYEDHLDEHVGRTVWTLKNAVTEALKAPIDPETGLTTRPGVPVAMERTIGLTSFLDEIVGFEAVATV